MPRKPAPRELICTVCRIVFKRAETDIQQGAYRTTCSKECRYISVSKTLMGHAVSDKTRKAVAQSNKKNPRHTTPHTPETIAKLTKINQSIYAPIKAHFGVAARRGSDFHFSRPDRRRLLAKNCIECGTADALQLDHIVPWFAGGTHTDDNVQTLCGVCNRLKHYGDLIKYHRLVTSLRKND